MYAFVVRLPLWARKAIVDFLSVLVIGLLGLNVAWPQGNDFKGWLVVLAGAVGLVVLSALRRAIADNLPRCSGLVASDPADRASRGSDADLSGHEWVASNERFPFRDHASSTPGSEAVKGVLPLLNAILDAIAQFVSQFTTAHAANQQRFDAIDAQLRVIRADLEGTPEVTGIQVKEEN